MEISYLKKSKKEIELEIRGEGHTLLNPLRKILFEDKNVIFAGYHVKHPMKDGAILIVKTDGTKSAKNALIDSLNMLKKRTDEFRQKFSAVKKEIS
ncbi:MAG: RpoL/Rpb11 RNA polymerase subunit family protein [Candidatus Odinarchaeia archaeon]